MSTMTLRELRDHLGTTVRNVGSTGHEVMITDNGKLVAVLIAPDDYERLHEHADAVDAFALRQMRAESSVSLRVPDTLEATLDRVVNDREEVVIVRPGREGVVLVAQRDYESLLATAHLMRSPANAARVLASIQELETGTGDRIVKTLEELRAFEGEQ